MTQTSSNSLRAHPITDRIPVDRSKLRTFEQWRYHTAMHLIEMSWRGKCDRKDVEEALDDAHYWRRPERCGICMHWQDECDCAKTGRR
jgi:hypothetical protein